MEVFRAMSSEAKRVRVILGTMTFGKEVDEATADRMVGIFLDAGYTELDTAFMYQDGRTEEILGRILTPQRRERVYLATKANPWSDAGLKPERVVEQVDISFERLRTDSVDLFYLHSPDLNTPVELTLEACQKLFEEGRFRELGLSNYTAWQVADIWHICKRNGWVLPTVYQGMYNATTRDVERELFPALRAFGMRFYAYNPLAGGLLTGKHAERKELPTEGRFALYAPYEGRYWKEAYLEAVRSIKQICDEKLINMAESALRWMEHHSRLQGACNDGIILGATNPEQLQANLKACEGGPLPEDVVAAFDRAWDMARPVCPHYFRT